jgi:hypothetical protein
LRRAVPQNTVTVAGDIRLAVSDEVELRYDGYFDVAVAGSSLFGYNKPGLKAGKYRVTVVVERLPQPGQEQQAVRDGDRL